MNSEKVMAQQKAAENRREDKRAFGKFMLVLIVCGIVGGIVGVLSVETSEGGLTFAALLGRAMKAIGPFGNVICTTIVLIAVVILTAQSRRLYNSWDGEDEEVMMRMDLKLSWGLFAISINTIASYFFFAAGIYALDFENADDLYDVGLFIKIALTFIGLLYSLVVNVLLQKNIVNFTKEINPEKQGSVYDMHFQKIWHESCDELERLQTYQAGFKAYQAGNYSCMGLWMFCLLGLMVWDFGMLPMVMVTFIWIVMTVRYYMECIHLTKQLKI